MGGMAVITSDDLSKPVAQALTRRTRRESRGHRDSVTLHETPVDISVCMAVQGRREMFAAVHRRMPVDVPRISLTSSVAPHYMTKD